MTMDIGDILRELTRERDPVTGREVWRLTNQGINAGISFHFRSQITADSRHLVFRRETETQTAILRADLSNGELTVVGVGPRDGKIAFAVVPGTHSVAVVCNGGVRLYDLDSLAERVLVEQFPDGYDCWCVFGLLDGTAVGYEMFRTLPYRVEKKHTYDTAEFDAYVKEFGGRPGKICVADIATGKGREVWDEPVAAGNHVQPSPTDPDVWLVERDQPPLFSWMGDHGRTPRAWLVNWRTGEAKPVANRNSNHFHMHSAWSHDGRYIYYHGRDRATGAPIGQNGGGHFIGAAAVAGEVVWEQVFPHYYYGHVAGHTRRNVILIDSLTTPDLIHEVAFLEPGAPKRVLGRHGSQVRYGRQETHPHLQMSPDGGCICYQRATGARADVCVLWLKGD
jgi:hypothetical protein